MANETKKITFPTQYNNSACFVSNAKNQKGLENEYKLTYDEKGNKKLVVSGKTNKYKKIQENSKGVDLYSILEKFAINGDISIFDKNKGFFTDITNMPTNIHEYRNKISEADNIYNGLPVEFKNLFGNNKNAFVNSLFDNSFNEKYENYVKDKASKGLKMHKEEREKFKDMTIKEQVNKLDKELNNNNGGKKDVE